jgi:hypothetical protein
MRRDLEPAQRAIAFVQNELKNGPLLATQVDEHAQRLGIGGSHLAAAKETLGGVVSRANSGKAGGNALTYSLPGS